MLFVPKGTEHMRNGKIWELSGYIAPRTHYSGFLDGSLLYVPWGLVRKVKVKFS